MVLVRGGRVDGAFADLNKILRNTGVQAQVNSWSSVFVVFPVGVKITDQYINLNFIIMVPIIV